MEILRPVVLMLAALMLSSCGEDSPTTPQSPIVPASVTLAVTVFNANTTSAGSEPPYPFINWETCWEETWSAAGFPAADASVGELTVVGERPNGNDVTWTFPAVGSIPAGGRVQQTRCVNYRSNANIGDNGVVDSLRFLAQGSDSLGTDFEYLEIVPLAKPDQKNIDTTSCTRDAQTLCVLNSRFKVTVDWRDDRDDDLQPAPILEFDDFGDEDSGVFLVSDDELVVELRNGCDENGHFWIFAETTTRVEYALRITDTASGQSRVYEKELGEEAQLIVDTLAFATCPGPIPVPND